MSKRKTIVFLAALSIVQVVAGVHAAHAGSFVPGQYIVVFEENILPQAAGAPLKTGETVRQAAQRLVNRARQHQQVLDSQRGVSSQSARINLGFVYEHAIKGFSASLTTDAVALLRRDPDVAYVEQDQYAELHVVQSPTPSWGLDRIDERDRPLDQSYEYSLDGGGVHVYVIDSGIRATHEEFTGRIGNGYDFIGNDTNPNDCNGHGTHVAGTVGGSDFGVAKNVTIHPVRVFGCSGGSPFSTIIAGVNWVADHHVGPAVANMSLGGPTSATLDAAVNNLINAGVITVVSAGNSNANACNFSPARVANALTIAASTIADSRDTTYSNFGTCVDLFAPGTDIVSAWRTSNTATATLDGTSMAAPHASGVAALYLDVQPGLTPAQVSAEIVRSATTNRITNAGTGSPNRLLYSRDAGSGSSSSSSSSSSSGSSCPAPGTEVAYACSSAVVQAAQKADATCCNGYYSTSVGGYGCYRFYCK